MSVLRKIWTALRGSARELGDAVVDAQSIRIFEQEIHDAQAAINDSKRALTSVMADKMKIDRRIAELNDQIADDEASAIKALDQDNEGLALEVAQRIAAREAERAEQAAISAQLEARITTLGRKSTPPRRSLPITSGNCPLCAPRKACKKQRFKSSTTSPHMTRP